MAASGLPIAFGGHPASVDQLGEALGILIVQDTGGESPPNGSGQVIERGRPARTVDRDGELISKHSQPLRFGAASGQASSLSELAFRLDSRPGAVRLSRVSAGESP